MNEDEVLVIGHRNPDTDAICSAIGYAEFKRRTGLPNAIAARCGDIVERVAFVLEHFGVPPPRYVADVSPRIRDVMRTNVVHLPPEATLMEALGVMDEGNIRVLPILKADGVCLGFVSVFKMTKFLCPTSTRLFDSRRVLTSMRNLTRTLGARTVVDTESDQEEELILMIGAMNEESFAKRLAKFPSERLLVIVGDQREIQQLAVRGKVRVLVVTGGLEVAPSIREEAQRHKVHLLISPHDTATTAALCRAAITVEHMVHEQFLSFREDELLAEVQGTVTSSQFQAFPILDAHKKTVGILSKSDFLKKVRRQLILVDHNELSQAVQGADQVEILEIIDHHRLGTLTTRHPILFRNEPVGSTSTIVADCFFRNQVELPKPIAGLLLAGLVSDTLNLTSPTTTERDAQILQKLEQITGINAAQFTQTLFASGSVLASRPVAEAILADCKEFQEKGRTFSAAQIEELGFDSFWQRSDDVMAALEDHRRQKGYYFAALLVTDVVKQTSLLVVTGAPAVLKQIDYPSLQPGIYELPGVVSRKKQLLPYLTDCLEKTGERPTAMEPLTMI
jgi:manganese-dependent inorganic pyrophosphatase